MKEQTGWNEPHTKPVRDGVYQRVMGRLYSVMVYSKFYNGRWNAGSHALTDAALQTRPSLYQAQPWRGLSANPHPQLPRDWGGGSVRKERGVSMLHLAFMIIIFIGVPWAWNAVKFLSCDLEPNWRCEVIHGVGVVVPPAALVTAWFAGDAE